MGGISMRRVLSGLVAASALCAALAACGGDPGGTTGAWKYDEAASVERAGDSKGMAANIRKTFAGMTAALEFHRDNSYHLTIAGGPDPREETGTFKTGNGNMVLNPKNRNGAAVDPTASEYTLRAPDSKHIELTLKGFPAVLIPTAPPGK